MFEFAHTYAARAVALLAMYGLALVMFRLLPELHAHVLRLMRPIQLALKPSRPDVATCAHRHSAVHRQASLTGGGRSVMPGTSGAGCTRLLFAEGEAESKPWTVPEPWLRVRTGLACASRPRVRPTGQPAVHHRPSAQHGQQQDNDQTEDGHGGSIGHHAVVDTRTRSALSPTPSPSESSLSSGSSGKASSSLGTPSPSRSMDRRSLNRPACDARPHGRRCRRRRLGRSPPINFVQVNHRFQILERDGIGLVGLFPNEEEFLCAGAQICFQFGHLEAFVLVADRGRLRVYPCRGAAGAHRG